MPFRSLCCLQVAAVVAQAMAQASGDAIIEVGASPAAEYEDIASQVAQALAGGEQEAAQEEEEEEEEEAAAPAKPAGFFTIGGTQKKQAGGFFTLGGTQKRQVTPVEEEEEEEEEVAAPAPAKKAGGFFTLGGTQRRQVAPVAAVEEEEEEEGEQSGSYLYMLCVGG